MNDCGTVDFSTICDQMLNQLYTTLDIDDLMVFRKGDYLRVQTMDSCAPVLCLRCQKNRYVEVLCQDCMVAGLVPSLTRLLQDNKFKFRVNIT